MSADLLAAFGTQQGRPCPQKEKKAEISSIPSNYLLAGLDTLSISHGSGAQHDPPSIARAESSLWHRDDRGADVLFDAAEDNVQIDEDFGDFEAPDVDAGDAASSNRDQKTYYIATRSPRVNSLAKATPLQSNVSDLLGLDDFESQSKPPPETPVGHIFPAAYSQSKQYAASVEVDEWGDFSDPVINDTAQETARESSQASTQPSGKTSTAPEDDWDVFEDGEATDFRRPPEENLQQSKLITPPLTAAALPREPAMLSSQQLCSDDATDIRPSNIPPPAILLQLLPRVFNMMRQDVGSGNRSKPSNWMGSNSNHIALTIIQGFMTAARIIAGRTLRWKRDAFLSQSMRIGPAGYGGGRGMKLTAIDKSENLKEEKEAADVVGIWEHNAHVFNTTVAKAGMQRPLMTLSLSLKARLEGGNGILKASHACALCGVKRDERILQVDVRVEDSFGEYWVEHWGHRDCRDFWKQYNNMLSQR